VHVVVVMAGFGERFRRAGFTVPKPLIPVHGRPMVHHVFDRFDHGDSGESPARITCLVNADHLHGPGAEGWALEATLRASGRPIDIVAVPSHREGPVRTVLHAAHVFDDGPTVLVMCDQDWVWDFAHFQRWFHASNADGAIVTYEGFHPHLLRSTHYAFVQHAARVASRVQEKASFTDDPIGNREACSNGVYALRRGTDAVRLARQVAANADLAIAGEHYVSQLFGPLLDEGGRVVVYDTPAFCQWGNPEDLADHVYAVRGFSRRAALPPPQRVRPGTRLLPMAGLGSRFAERGYALPKPLVPVGGVPLAVAALRDLPAMARTVVVVRRDLPGLDAILTALGDAVPGLEAVVLDRATDGQAVTVAEGLRRARVDLDAPLVIGACDNGFDLDEPAHAEALSGADALVWVMRGHPHAQRHPRMFGWVEEDDAGRITGVSVKAPPTHPADPAVAGIVTGAFSARRAGVWAEAIDRLVARDGRVRGELYLDSAVTDLLAAGRDVRAFDVWAYHGWGTPDELETWSYWQRWTHHQPWHPYRMDRDPRVTAAAVAAAAWPAPPALPPLSPVRGGRGGGS
jgi:NDP-sugar pyrophosphorylase family protein